MDIYIYGPCVQSGRAGTHHIEGGKHVTVVVVGLQIFRDVSERREVFWVLGGAGDITNFMLSNYVLEETTQTITVFLGEPACFRISTVILGTQMLFFFSRMF